MPSRANMLPRKTITEMIIYILGQKGRTIDMIELQAGKRYAGDESQKARRDNLEWHDRRRLIEVVAEKLKIHHEFVGPNRTSNDFYNVVDQEIAKLKRQSRLVEWNSTRRVGIWRVVDVIPTRSAPKMSVEKPPTPPTRTEPLIAEGDLKQTFLSILTKGKKDNTYKFTLAKSLLDYCSETTDKTAKTHEIPYRYFASKFLKY